MATSFAPEMLAKEWLYDQCKYLWCKLLLLLHDVVRLGHTNSKLSRMKGDVDGGKSQHGSDAQYSHKAIEQGKGMSDSC